MVELREVDSWTPEQAFCLFFAPPPTSRDDEIRPGSAVTIIGKIQDDTESLKQVPSAASGTIEAA